MVTGKIVQMPHIFERLARSGNECDILYEFDIASIWNCCSPSIVFFYLITYVELVALGYNRLGSIWQNSKISPLNVISYQLVWKLKQYRVVDCFHKTCHAVIVMVYCVGLFYLRHLYLIFVIWHCHKFRLNQHWHLRWWYGVVFSTQSAFILILFKQKFCFACWASLLKLDSWIFMSCKNLIMWCFVIRLSDWLKKLFYWNTAQCTTQVMTILPIVFQVPTGKGQSQKWF